MTPIEALMTVCLVAHQAGVIRDVSRADIDKYPAAVTFPCSMDDDAMLYAYGQEIRQQQERLCPGCFPWR